MGRPFIQNPVLRALDLAAIYLRTTLPAWRDRARFEHVRTYVSFIGYPRSGHSLVAALLDAHPHAVIAHEEKALQYVNVGFDRDRIFSRLVRNAREVGHTQGFAGERSGGYDYDVPGQWQGRAERVEVIGDKHGGYNATRLAQAPYLEARLRQCVGVETRYIRVLRNPFDTISTMARRAAEPLGTLPDLDEAIDQYAALCLHNLAVERLVGGAAIYTVRHEDFVADPAGELTALCQWLGLAAYPDYVDACAAQVFDAPRRTAGLIPWERKAQRRVETLIERTSFLAGYARTP